MVKINSAEFSSLVVILVALFVALFPQTEAAEKPIRTANAAGNPGFAARRLSSGGDLDVAKLADVLSKINVAEIVAKMGNIIADLNGVRINISELSTVLVGTDDVNVLLTNLKNLDILARNVQGQFENLFSLVARTYSGVVGGSSSNGTKN